MPLSSIQEETPDHLNSSNHHVCLHAEIDLFRFSTCFRNRRCFKEETFGPLIPLFKFETEAEAITLANTTEYGEYSAWMQRSLMKGRKKCLCSWC